MLFLYAGALTIGVSTATCESSFSTLTRVLRPYRRSMGRERKVQLVLLAFEKALTLSVNLNAFVDRFALKSRRVLQRYSIQLFLSLTLAVLLFWSLDMRYNFMVGGSGHNYPSTPRRGEFFFLHA